MIGRPTPRPTARAIFSDMLRPLDDVEQIVQVLFIEKEPERRVELSVSEAFED